MSNSPCQSKKFKDVGQQSIGQQRRSLFSIKLARRRDGGQIIVEYVLLLVVGVTMAALITSLMVSRNEESPGFLIRKWRDILELVGGDFPDDVADQ